MVGAFVLLCLGAEPLPPKVTQAVASQMASLVRDYNHLHQNPELSLQEVKTAAFLAGKMRALGFEVTEKVGGTGVVCVMKNGQGPVVLVRTDTDALPILERTGLVISSRAQGKNPAGETVPVMHACGHDIHMTSWLGAATILAQDKDLWQGTLVFIAQPAEEIGVGARAMLADGLFTRFPKPDFAFALHVDGTIPHGEIAYSVGPALANVDSVDITVKGKGGHGSQPHRCVDPIVLGAKIVLGLQTIVSRENDPFQPAVITVGSFHGGTKHNIIPGEVKLQITVRSFSDEVRARLLEGIRRTAKGEAIAAGAPEPLVEIRDHEFTPALINDTVLAKETAQTLGATFGTDRVKVRAPILGGEDFSRYGRAGVPVFMWFVGTASPEAVAKAKGPGGVAPPSLHSEFFAPVAQPTIEVGVKSLVSAVLSKAKKK